MIVEMLTSYFEPYKGGVETVVLNLAEGLGKKGHKVFIHTANATPGKYKNLKSYEEHKYYTIKRYTAYPYSLIFPKFFYKDSILSLHNYSCLMNDYVALRYPKQKKVLTPYGNITYDPQQRYHRNLAPLYDAYIGKRTLSLVDKIVAMTKFEKKGIIEKFPQFNNKVEVVAAGMSFMKNSSKFKKPFHFPYFISVGRIVATKHFDNVLRIMKYFPEYHYVLAGRDIGHAAELKKLAKELGLQKRFHYVGEVTEKEKVTLLSYGSVFIMPDSANAFGIANLEGFYYLGKVVAAKSGGMFELTEEFGGESFEVGDLHGLKLSLEKSLHKSLVPHEKDRIKKSIENKYSWDAVVAQYENVLINA